MRRLLLKSVVRNRGFLEKATLALALPFVAGMVNAEGFVIVGVYTSHVTGTVARAGDALARGQLFPALGALALVAAFYAGAVLATALGAQPSRGTIRRPTGRYSLALAAEVLMLLAVTLLGAFEVQRGPGVQLATVLLFCGAMGAQNALVSRLSGAVVRNTHLTGIVTDLGIETVHVLHRLFSPAGRTQRHLTGPVGPFRWANELRRLRLHGAIFVSFLLGAVIGPLLYLREGYIALLLPVSVLTALMVFDTAVGLRSQAPGEESSEHGGPPAPP